MRTDDVPRTELSPRELGLAVQENLWGLFRAMRRLPGAELVEMAALSRHHASPSNPMFKGIWNVQDAGAVDEALAWLREREAPYAFVWLGPDAEPEGARAHLERLGLVVWEADAPAYAAELAELDWDAVERVPDGFTIERVGDAGLEAFGSTFVEAFAAPVWAGQAWVDATRALGSDAAPWALYLGRLDGEPVATTILTPGGGVAGVLGVGTLPSARRRGIGAAITLAAYRDAQELGYRYGVLFSTLAGEPVYRRIGLRPCGTGITRYLWRVLYQ